MACAAAVALSFALCRERKVRVGLKSNSWTLVHYSIQEQKLFPFCLCSLQECSSPFCSIFSVHCYSQSVLSEIGFLYKARLFGQDKVSRVFGLCQVK